MAEGVRKPDMQASPAADLAGKVAVVTGAGSGEQGIGVGEAIAIVFAREGAKVWIVDLDAERAERTRAAIAAEGHEASVLVGDVTRDETGAALMATIAGADGGVDVLVNNVALAPPAANLHDADEATWDRMMAVNVRSAFVMSKHAIPRLAARGGGAIVNIASTGGIRAGGGGAGYGPSKAAVIMLTRELAVGYGRQGIRANAIAPGHIITPMAAPADAAGWDVRRKIAPLGTEGTSWDIAWAAVFLASERARFITGTCLAVDGGVTEMVALRGVGFAQEADS